MGINTKKKRLLTFVMIGLVMQTLVQDTIPFVLARRSYLRDGSRRHSVIVSGSHIKVPSTKAPATTFHTSAKIRAGGGVSSTQGVSFRYSSLTMKALKSTISNEKVPKSTQSSAEPTALNQEADITITKHVQRPTKAVFKGNSCVTGGYSVNTTRSPPLETSGMDKTESDGLLNSSGKDGGQKRNKALSPDDTEVKRNKNF